MLGSKIFDYLMSVYTTRYYNKNSSSLSCGYRAFIESLKPH